MPNLAGLNDQQNLTLTQISYCSNMLSDHNDKTFSEIMTLLADKQQKDIALSEEEKKFVKLMNQFPADDNPFADYVVKGTHNDSTGFGAVAFTDGDGNTGISYRGTDGAPSKKSINDWVDNIIACATGDSAQSHEAEAFFERYSDPNGNNYLYGHSKGGNLSEYVYVRNYDKIKGMHLLNPQPLNPWTLNAKQLEAMRSDKVDIVIVEGDYVWFLGMLPSYNNVRVVNSNGGDSHSYWSIDFKEGSVSPGSHPWWEYGVYGIVVVLSPFIQGTGAMFDFFCDCVELFVNELKKGWEKCKEFGLWLCDQVKKIGKQLEAFADSLKDFFGELISKAKDWYNRNLNAGYKYATANPGIVVDTYKLQDYADRITKVHNRIKKVDQRLDSLYWKVGFLDLWNLLQADLLTGYSWRLNRCASYLNDTARDFENVETALVNNL